MRTVLVLMDTLRRDALSCYCPERSARTPNLEAFAQDSVVFDNHWIGSAPCMPARRDIMCGRYNFLERPWGPIEPFDVTLVDSLRAGGVYTCIKTDHCHYERTGGEGYLLGREVPFGAYHDDRLYALADGAGKVYLLIGALGAVGYEAHGGNGRGDELRKRGHGVELRQEGLERLFHGRDDNTAGALVVYGASFAVVAPEGHDARYAHLDGLFEEPLETVDILCGGYGHCERIWESFVVGDCLHDLDGAVFGCGLDDAGAVEGAAAVGQVERVARAHAQHAVDSSSPSVCRGGTMSGA